MAHLTKPQVYDINDTNIALLGSDLEKRVREFAGSTESAWLGAGSAEGIEVWRIEQFKVVEWPESRKGSFYEGDSYIVLHTYKKTPESKTFSYDLHFWLGRETTQDEAGTAAYKTVELDDHLHGVPVQYRESQGNESPRFLSYFPTFLSLKGGVSTGFHHVSDPPPRDILRLYRISSEGSGLVVREVPPHASSLVSGDVYVLDKGMEVWQFNTKTSVGKEKFRGAEFVGKLLEGEGRRGCELVVYDEGNPGAGVFLSFFGVGTTLLPASSPSSKMNIPSSTLYLLSDATGTPIFTRVRDPISRSLLSSSDAYILDYTSHPTRPSVYVWLGEDASLGERRLAGEYARRYLGERREEEGGFAGDNKAVPVIVKVSEGNESDEFLAMLDA